MKWIVFVILGLLFAGVMVWVFLPGKSVLSANQEDHALKNLLGRDPHTTVAEQSTAWLVHKSSFLQFSYPSWAKVYAVDNQKALQNPTTLDSFSLGILDEHVYAVIQAVKFDDELVSYPAVNLRLSQADIYTKASLSGSLASMSFTKTTDGIEHSEFFQQGNIVVSVAVTGFSQGDVDTLFNGITRSLIIF